jgi:hypothetical protein
MGMHRKDIGAVQQRLVGVRIIFQDTVHQFILPQHGISMARTPAALQVAWSRSARKMGGFGYGRSGDAKKRGPANVS